jgi:hypothetical protein
MFVVDEGGRSGLDGGPYIQAFMGRPRSPFLEGRCMIKITNDNLDQIKVGSMLYFDNGRGHEAFEIVISIEADRFKARTLWSAAEWINLAPIDAGALAALTFSYYYLVA